jgi:hypothetical protein
MRATTQIDVTGPNYNPPKEQKMTPVKNDLPEHEGQCVPMKLVR